MPFNLCKCGEMYRIGTGCPSCGKDELKIKKIKEKTTKAGYGPKNCHRCGKRCYGYLCGDCNEKKKHRVNTSSRYRRNKKNTSAKEFFNQFGHRGTIKEKFKSNERGKGAVLEEELGFGVLRNGCIRKD